MTASTLCVSAPFFFGNLSLYRFGGEYDGGTYLICIVHVTIDGKPD
jgi:hypothetical protein